MSEADFSLNPDAWVLFHLGPVAINATLFFTWLIMLVLVLGSWLITRKLSTGPGMTRRQLVLEILVKATCDQIREISHQSPKPFLPFAGSLFLYIAVANLLAIIPGYQPPTGSLSTTTALAFCVFAAVPFYGIQRRGLRRYLADYLKPSPIMLPFNIIGEFSRTLALAVRLYGNIMSGVVIIGILLAIVPLFFPIVMEVLGLLTGFIQAYIFAVLALVYIAAATGEATSLNSEQGAAHD